MSIQVGDFSAKPEGPPTKTPVLITFVLFTQLGGSSLFKHVEERLMIEIVRSKDNRVETVLFSPSIVKEN